MSDEIYLANKKAFYDAVDAAMKSSHKGDEYWDIYYDLVENKDKTERLYEGLCVTYKTNSGNLKAGMHYLEQTAKELEELIAQKERIVAECKTRKKRAEICDVAESVEASQKLKLATSQKSQNFIREKTAEVRKWEEYCKAAEIFVKNDTDKKNAAECILLHMEENKLIALAYKKATSQDNVTRDLMRTVSLTEAILKNKSRAMMRDISLGDPIPDPSLSVW